MQLIQLIITLLGLAYIQQARAQLKQGDIILQPLNCWACNLIEAEEKSIFSHMGIVLKTDPVVLIAESFGSTRVVTFKEFNSKTEKNQRIKVIRFKDESIVELFSREKNDLFEFYYKYFNGLPYDSEFRWDNIDEDGKERLYCSEFVSKLLFMGIGYVAPTKPMHFLENRQYWLKYFQGKVPDGENGNSPADFERSSIFEEVQFNE